MKGETPLYRVVIPARLASTRLPEKALADVGGKPLVVRVLERARESGAADVIVATDDARVVAAVEAAGGRAVMTSSEHRSGTDRIAEVAGAMGWGDDDVVVNLQGDEPLVPGALLDGLAAALAGRADAAIATLATPIREAREVFDPNAVKVVRDDAGYAMYFSRAPVPWAREAFSATAGQGAAALPEGVPYLRHLGLYAYRVRTLQALSRAEEGVLEEVEKLEQLRALAMGMKIWVGVVEEAPPPGVDSAEDLARVRAMIARGSFDSSS